MPVARYARWKSRRFPGVKAIFVFCEAPGGGAMSFFVNVRKGCI